jgi:hypothetical protein
MEKRPSAAKQAAEKVLEFDVGINYEGSCAVVMISSWVFSVM